MLQRSTPAHTALDDWRHDGIRSAALPQGERGNMPVLWQLIAILVGVRFNRSRNMSFGV